MNDNNSSSSEAEGEVFEFDCPECGTHIVGEVNECPNCGIEFIIEEVHEYDCPECGTLVNEEMGVCPECGTDLPPSEEPIEGEREAEGPVEEAALEETVEEPTPVEEAEEEPEEVRTPAEDFPELVEEVSSKLDLAKEAGLDTLRAKKEIDKAVGAGRKGRYELATKTLSKAMNILDEELSGRLETIGQRLRKSVDAAESINEDPSEIEQALSSLNESIEDGDYRASLELGKEALKKAERVTGKYFQAQDTVSRLEDLIEGAELFQADVEEARSVLEEAKEAGNKEDWRMMTILAETGIESINEQLHDIIKKELKKCKKSILRAKTRGKDVTALVSELKKIGIAFNEDEYEIALNKLVDFKPKIEDL